MHSPTPNSLLILHWWILCKVPVRAAPCWAPTTIILVGITRGAAEATSNIFSVATLVSVLKDLLWMPASLVSISSRTRRSRTFFIEESITITPSALFHEQLSLDLRIL